MLPKAPARLSINTGCLRRAGSAAESTRATTSTPPPGGYGTTMRMGFEGYSCASEYVAEPIVIRAAAQAMRAVPAATTMIEWVLMGLRLRSSMRGLSFKSAHGEIRRITEEAYR